MFIKPREGLLIRDPVTKMHLLESGTDVHGNDLFWQHRLRDGDVVLAASPAPAPEPEVPAAPADKTSSNQE